MEANTAPLKKFVFDLLIQWSIGFAFTGFQLIQPAFINFLRALLNYGLSSN